MMKFFSAILCSGLLFCWVRADFIQKAGDQQFRWGEDGTLQEYRVGGKPKSVGATPGSLPRWTPKPASAPISPGNSPPKRMEQYVIAAAPRTLLWNWMSYSARMRQVFCGHRRP